MQTKVKIILIPGNGGEEGEDPMKEDHWFYYLYHKLTPLGYEVIVKSFPDPKLARSKYWLPFIKELGADENTLLIGHSSGAVAAMRYAEKNKILGSILVAGNHTDLGMESEKVSGYFDDPWNWAAIKKNQKWIVQFHSQNDLWIPVEEARYIHEKLDSQYYEMTHEGHFGGDREKREFPEIVSIIKAKTC